MPKIFFAADTKGLPFSAAELNQMPNGFKVVGSYPVCDFVVKNNQLFDGEYLDDSTDVVEFKTKENTYQAYFNEASNLLWVQLKYKEISKADQKRISKLERLFLELKENGVGWISVEGGGGGGLVFSAEMEDLSTAFRYECNGGDIKPKFTYHQHEENWQNSTIGMEQIVP